MLINQFPNKKKFCDMAKKYNVIPVCFEMLADTETPVTMLKKFYNPKKPIALFESVEGKERWGRYSFLMTSASGGIRIFKDYVEIQNKNKTEKINHNGDPLKVLKKFMAQYIPANIPELPRFWGGIVGYFGYETVSFFEKIPNSFPPDKPIAKFIIPDSLIIFDNVKHTITGAAIAFIKKKNQAADLYDDAIKKLNNLIDTIKKKSSKKTFIPEDNFKTTPQCNKEDYIEKVKKVKNYIKSGEVIQAVISQPFVSKAPSDLSELYRAQRYINPSPYLYFLNIDKTALIGSSPETMVRLENRIATLRPIAGTRPRGENEILDIKLANELLADEKEKAEHLMLVDLGRNDLGKIAKTGTVQVTDLMVVERYSHVMHLVSNITCDIEDNKDAWDLIKATFPAGTLSGAPKIRAMEIIAELEDTYRDAYGGAIGYISFSGNMDMAIIIRTAVVEDNKLTVTAGAGIVADSDPEAEHRECINKSKAIQKALTLLKNRETSIADFIDKKE
ncbi:MAG: anthranilate synthase component I family protein [Deltaproteobacteria bacterium]|nr:anthranilate synthase component I family protein [Deltaproteobacteria bacterium]